MSTYLGLPVLVIAALIDAAIMPFFQLGGGSPELVFLLVIAWGVLVDVREGMTWAVIGGVLRDSFSVAPLGTSALGMVIVVFMMDSAFPEHRRRNVLVPLVMAVVGTALYHAISLIVLRLTGYYVPVGRGLTYVTLPTLILNGVLAIPVYQLVFRVRQWFAPVQRRVE